MIYNSPITEDALIQAVAVQSGNLSESNRLIIESHITSVLLDIASKVPRLSDFETSITSSASTSRYYITLQSDVNELYAVFSDDNRLSYISPEEYTQEYPSFTFNDTSPTKYTLWKDKIYINASTDASITYWYYKVPGFSDLSDKDVLFWGLLVRVLSIGDDKWTAAMAQYQEGIRKLMMSRKSVDAKSKFVASKHIRDSMSSRTSWRGRDVE